MVSKRTRIIAGAATAAAALGLMIKVAKTMHKKGYDRKAIVLLKKAASKIKSEAVKMEKKSRAKPAKKKK